MAKNYPVKVTMGNCLLQENGQDMTDEQLRKYDIFIWHKTLFDLQDIRRVNDLGIPTIIDFDDHWVVGRDHSLYKQYTKEGLSTKLHKALITAKYVTCTTETLANEIYQYNKNVNVLPNAIDGNYDGWKPGRVQEDKYIFGYLGGPCHVRDISLLRGVQSKLTESEKNYELRLFGYDGSDIYKYYANILSHYQHSENYSIYKGADIFNYPQFYNYMDCSLVPLEANKFNSMKSELKMIEAGYFKKPVIVSNVEPYTNLINKKNCLVVNTPNDWYNHIKYLIHNKQAGIDMGEELHLTIQPFMIDRVNKIRYKLYKDVCKINNTNRGNIISRMETVI